MKNARLMRRMIWLTASIGGSGFAGAQVYSPSFAGQKTTAAVPLNTVSPTSAPAADISTTVSARVPSQRPAKRAEISYTNGQLTVKAENSSLNLILREIGRQTGIKITGGVAEERVFGSYGPAVTADVLNRLLDGTGSNMMLLATEAGAPGELILTPRLGGPTPPNPNAKGFDDDSGEDDDAPRRQPQQRGVTLFGGAAAAPAEAPSAAAAPSAPPVTPAGTDANGVAPAANTPQSPNGVKTPQEIYQQLQQLRQQQQQAEPPPQ